MPQDLRDAMPRYNAGERGDFWEPPFPSPRSQPGLVFTLTRTGPGPLHLFAVFVFVYHRRSANVQSRRVCQLAAETTFFANVIIPLGTVDQRL